MACLSCKFLIEPRESGCGSKGILILEPFGCFGSQNRPPPAKPTTLLESSCVRKRIRPALPDDGNRAGKSTPALIPAPRSQKQGRFRLCKILVHFVPLKWVRAAARFSPLGLGVRQADSQTLCLPRAASQALYPPLRRQRENSLSPLFRLFPTNLLRWALLGVLF